MLSTSKRSPRGRFRRQAPKKKMSIEDKIKSFVLRNSRMGFFTNSKTIITKFSLTEEEAMTHLGFLLSDNVLECTHGRNGEMKLCEAGKRTEIQQGHAKPLHKRSTETQHSSTKPQHSSTKPQHKSSDARRSSVQKPRGPRSNDSGRRDPRRSRSRDHSKPNVNTPKE